MATSFYERRAEELVLAALATDRMSFADILRKTRGTPPELVYRILSREGFQNNTPADSATNSPCSDPDMEPHLLDADWRFSVDTRHALSALLRPFEQILLLGTPTLYDTMFGAVDGLSERVVTLIDRRLPRGGSETRLSLDIRAIGRSHVPRALADVCVFDAPWYPEEFMAWFSTAVNSVKKGGQILFSMWQEMVRPTAERERTELLETLKAYGTLDIKPDALVYDTPLFERLAYLERGIVLPSIWRRGDLISYRLTGKPAFEAPAILKAEWHRFTFQNYQIAIRRASSNGATKTCAAWTLDSVSRRDPSRSTIDIWDSHNRVATSGQTDRLIQKLNLICAGQVGEDDSDYNLLQRSGFFPHGFPKRGVTWLQSD